MSIKKKAIDFLTFTSACKFFEQLYNTLSNLS